MKYENYIDYDLDLTVTSVDMVMFRDCPPTWKLNSPPRKQCALVYILDGEAQYIFPDRTEQSSPNSLVFFDFRDTYRTSVISDNNYKFIVIALTWTPTDISSKLPFKTVNPIMHAHRFIEQFKNIEELWNSKGFGYKIHVKAAVTSLIYELIKESAQKHARPRVDEQIQVSKAYIDTNYATQIRVETLAKLCGYSTSHFRKKFFEVYGVSPIAYINHVRIEKAKKMLKSGFYQNEEIAKLVGFSSSYYFCRVFKRLTGLTPKQY